MRARISATRPGTLRSTTAIPWRVVCIALFGLTLVWKLSCLRRLVTSIYFPTLSADATVYWGWAHLLHEQGWVGANPFFLAPLYPYLLAVLRLNGDSQVPALLFQCALGAGSVVWIASSARHLSSTAGAIFAGILAAGYGMATLLDLSLLSESTLWFLGSLFVFLHVRRDAGPSARDSALAGLLIGLMTLARPSFLLLLAPHAVRAWSSGGWRGALRASSAAALVVALVCTPTLVRHIALGHGPIPITYSLGYNFYVGNSAAATGAYTSVVDDDAPGAVDSRELEGGIGGDGRRSILLKDGVWLTARQSSRYWFETAWQQISASPGRTLKLLWFKLRLSLNAREATQLDNLDVQQRLLGPYGLPLLGTFAFVAVLGLFGLASQWRNPKTLFLAACFLSVWLPIVLFFVTDRYRFHLVPPLLVSSGIALDRVRQWFQRENGIPRLRELGVMTALALCIGTPLVPFHREQVEFESHRLAGEAHLRRGELTQAAQEFTSALAPGILEGLPLEKMRSARVAVAGVLQSLADTYLLSERYSEQEHSMRLAVLHAPDVRELRLAHVQSLAIAGSMASARSEARVLGLGPRELSILLVRAAEGALHRHSIAPAERALWAAVAADSTSEAANVVLMRLLAAQGDSTRARDVWRALPRRGIANEVVEREGLAMGLLH